jgi:hypothetical protein
MDAQHRAEEPESQRVQADDFFNANEVLQKDPKLTAINFFGWTPLRCICASKANG